MIDNTNAVVVYSPPNLKQNKTILKKFAKFSTLCEKLLRKHEKTILFFFIISVLSFFFAACVAYRDCSVCFNAEKVGYDNILFHIPWITFQILCGLTIYGKLVAVLSNIIVSSSLCFQLIVLLLSFESYTYFFIRIFSLLLIAFFYLYFNVCVFDYSKKAIRGRESLFAVKAFREYLATSVFFLLFYISFSVINI